MTSTTDKKLNDNLRKCRCCFRMIIDERKSVEITNEIKTNFVLLTQIELLESSLFSSKICQMCESDLKTFAAFRLDVIEKQKNLYQIAGLTEDQFIFKNDQNNEQDFNIIEEFIEMEDRDEIKDETTVDEFETFEKMETNENSLIEDNSSSIQVENSNQKSNETFSYQDDEATTFEFLEELVDEDDEEQTQRVAFSELVHCDLCLIELPLNHFEEHVKLLHCHCQCSECAEEFNSKILLKRHHLHKHITDKNLKLRKVYCYLCLKDYRNRKHLDDHVRSYHEHERNSECNICHKKFFYRDLKKHIEHVHGEKKIYCEVCGKKYSCIENLRLHLRYHESPKFTCNFSGCGKKFHQKVLLVHHSLTHTAEKNIQCDQCTMNFFSLRDLRRHNERIHEKIMRQCSFCESKFSRKDKLRQHVIKMHKEISDSAKQVVLDQIRKMKWNEP